METRRVETSSLQPSNLVHQGIPISQPTRIWLMQDEESELYRNIIQLIEIRPASQGKKSWQDLHIKKITLTCKSFVPKINSTNKRERLQFRKPSCLVFQREGKKFPVCDDIDIQKGGVCQVVGAHSRSEYSNIQAILYISQKIRMYLRNLIF